MKRLLNIFVVTLLLGGGFSMGGCCKVEVDDGLVQDAAEEIAED